MWRNKSAKSIQWKRIKKSNQSSPPSVSHFKRLQFIQFWCLFTLFWFSRKLSLTRWQAENNLLCLGDEGRETRGFLENRLQFLESLCNRRISKYQLSPSTETSVHQFFCRHSPSDSTSTRFQVHFTLHRGKMKWGFAWRTFCGWRKKAKAEKKSLKFMMTHTVL